MSSSAEAGSIDITRYAEVMAHLRHFPADKYSEVVARLGIRRRDWDTAAAKWRATRDAERMSGKLDATIRFGKVMTETLARLSATVPSIESLGPLPGPDGMSAGAPVAAAAKATPVLKPEESGSAVTPAVQVPSYLAADSLGAARTPEPVPASLPPVKRPPAEIASTMLGSAAPVGAVMPFAAPTSPSEALQRAMAHAESVQVSPGARREAVGSGTVAAVDDLSFAPLPAGVTELTLQQYASLRAELEARPLDVPATSSRYRVSPEGQDALHAHWKTRLSADPTLGMLFATTYARYLAWLKANPRPESPPATSVAAPLQRPPSELASTSAIMAAPVLPAMPFVPPTGSQDEIVQRAIAHAEAVQGPAEPRRAPVGSETVAVGDGVSAPPLPPGVPELTLQQYASLRVELDTTPNDAATILSRYGVTPDMRDALEAYWRARRSADRVLGMTYARTYAEYLAWFKANRR